MVAKSPARVATNLLGRIVTKAASAIPGEPMWPVNDPMVFVETFPAEHKAEIVAVWIDNDGDLKLGCRTLLHGLMFTVYAIHGHTVSSK